MFKNNTIGFSNSLGVLGGIAEYSLIKRTITLQVGMDKHEVAIDDVILLEQIGELNGDFVFDNDVLKSEVGLFEVVLTDNVEVEFYFLNNKYERVNKDATISKKSFNSVIKDLELVGSIHELKAQKKTVDFNITIVKDFDGTSYTYYYACNNKETEEIDLIKVVFVGTELLKEEDYTRTTLSHDVYLDSVEAGTLKEVSQGELRNYAYGMMNEAKRPTMGIKKDTYEVKEEELLEDDERCDCEACCELEEEFEKDFEQLDLEDYCEECGEVEEECECRGW